MNPLTSMAMKISMLFGRRRFHSDLDEEMTFHREQVEKELMERGMSAAQARREAARQFGNATHLRDESHRVIAFQWETVWQDLRFALRQFRQSPGFVLTAIFILAVGMGVSVAIFAFADAAVIQPLPYFEPNRLMDVAESGETLHRSNLSRADYEDWKRLNHSFSSLDVYGGSGYLLRTPSGTEPVPAGRVSDGLFRTLGVKPMLGRDFLPGEDRPGGAKIVMLSYGTWRKRFGARREIVGQAITLDGTAYTVIGVLPLEFEFAPRANAEFFVPLLDKNECEKRRSCHNLFGIGRLREGVSGNSALNEMKAIAAQLEIQYPDSNKFQGAVVQPLSEIIVGPVRPIMLTLLAASGLLLVIASVNVASLLLVRSESRRREIAVRGALGATPARISRQFVTEAFLLGLLGCSAGFLVADGSIRVLTSLIPKTMAQNLPFLWRVGIHWHEAAFCLLIAILASGLMAATPIVRLTFADVRDALSDGNRSVAGRFWRRMGANLVVVELSLAVILLFGAGLLSKSFYRLLKVDVGFDATHLATLQVVAPPGAYSKPEQQVSLFRELSRKLSSLPGVESVGITSDLPIQCNCNTDWIRIVGKPFHGEHNEVNERDVSPSYLPTLKAQLIRGRLFSEDDNASKSNKIIINKLLAEKYFPGEDPIGKMIANGGLDPKSMREIIGVVGNVREGGLDEELWPTEYEAIYQSPASYVAVAVRTVGDEGAFLPSLIKAVHEVDPTLGTYGELTMKDQMNSTQSAMIHRTAMWLVDGFAAIALVLAAVGLYGVIAYSVGQRTREIGVRMALGAQRSAVYAMVMRQAGWLTLAGVAIGVGCAIGAASLGRKLLFGVAAWDVPTLAIVAVVLASASLAASFLPAHRAASVNPTDALRSE
ncbi:ABC transporter permease [Occallatibacter savannae]|uniref:ABC transporter permease n=1 Tax=Occallatibacter savannae TaxID=1002691 RepID=UPI000D694B7F|nr:ABC transporter permease [Occallatibacter savannae]